MKQLNNNLTAFLKINFKMDIGGYETLIADIAKHCTLTIDNETVSTIHGNNSIYSVIKPKELKLQI